MIAIRGRSFSVAALAAAGVKRVSLATSLYRAAMTGLFDAAREIKEHGTCRFLGTALATPDLNRLFADGSSSSRG
jgi:2-methylisocitrate lyase-like PEP mutase family enzyme